MGIGIVFSYRNVRRKRENEANEAPAELLFPARCTELSSTTCISPRKKLELNVHF